MAALPAPNRFGPIPDIPRTEVEWATKRIAARDADEGFYRISGMKGSGKSHLTKLFILDALREVEANPQAKLIVYEPKREFYAWLKSLGLRSKISYFMPSDKRSVALDFTKDYRTDQDGQTLANAFYPPDVGEQQRFWGDAMRSIYSAVYTAIRQSIGRCDLRLMCLVLEHEEYARKVLGSDAYLINALKLLADHGGNVTDTGKNIQMTIHSRITEMKVIAAHLDQAEKVNGLFSLREFVKGEEQGILVVSKDSDYKLTQDPMNGVVFLRLMQLLDKEQQDPKRRVFIVIDEFPTLTGDKPCPGIEEMFLRLRSRGVTMLVTYQAHSTLKRIYGEHAAETIGQCSNVIYLRQADNDSAAYAADDLGRERGREKVASPSYGREGWSNSRNNEWYDRHIYAATELQNGIPPATRQTGVQGKAKSPGGGLIPWSFTYPPEFIDRIPKRDVRHEEYIEWEPETQRLRALSDDEMQSLELTTNRAQPERDQWHRPEDFLDN